MPTSFDAAFSKPNTTIKQLSPPHEENGTEIGCGKFPNAGFPVIPDFLEGPSCHFSPRIIKYAQNFGSKIYLMKTSFRSGQVIEIRF
jgi:hypothetical protein